MDTATLPGIGHNQPPEPTPFEIAEKEINDLYGECKLWLDGAVVDSQEIADGIGNLLAMIREAENKAEAARVVEKKPYDEKITEIQARYAPLIANTKAIKGKTVLATEACKRALQPWLAKKAREIEEAARKAREEADRKQREAQEAMRAAEAANLAARERAEALYREAQKADTAANKAERQTAKAGGSFGRAASLRSSFHAVLTDAVLAARHYWKRDRDEMETLLQRLADRDVRSGERNIPGFDVIEEAKTV